MNLTLAQKQVLKAKVTTEYPAAPDDIDTNTMIADALNLLVEPPYWVWRTQVPPTDWFTGTFDFARVAALSVGEARVWTALTDVKQFPYLNMSVAAIRAGVEFMFSVAGLDMPCRQAIYTASQRRATVAEKTFAVGAGTVSNDHGVGPSTMAAEGNLTYQDVADARHS